MKKYQHILSIKPTQFSVGIYEIELKIEELKAMKKKKRAKHVEENAVPIIISPKKEIFAIDHHHFLVACWQAGIEHVKIKVVEDLSKSRLSYKKFWQLMKSKQWTYLFDQFGDGPRNPLYLPTDIRGLADDPYRSLSWLVRKQGGYESSDKTFCEFKWADYLRRHKLLDERGREALDHLAQQALKLCRKSAAKNLPGFIGVPKKAGSK